MVTFKGRLAPIQGIVPVFAACVVPVYGWSILRFFYAMPSWLLHLKTWDLIGVFAYTQVLALLESAAVLLVVILLAAILPAHLLRDRFVPQGSMVVFLTSGWAIVAKHTGRIPFSESAPWPSRSLLCGGVLYLATIGVSHILIRRSKRLETAINSLMDRLTVFLYVYMPASFLSSIIVILRNLQGTK